MGRQAQLRGREWLEDFYPGAGESTLREVSLTVRRGQVVAFVGMSGAGKSTLMDLAAAVPRCHHLEWLEDFRALRPTCAMPQAAAWPLDRTTRRAHCAFRQPIRLPSLCVHTPVHSTQHANHKYAISLNIDMPPWRILARECHLASQAVITHPGTQ